MSSSIPVANGVALDAALGSYQQLQQGFPDKHVVIGEVGWPSNGDRRRTAQPSLADEAHFLREWFNVAAREKLDYYMMEAIDQPWKEQTEGRAGAYWGMLQRESPAEVRVHRHR